MDFEIVTDSCCNLLEDMIDDFGIHVLPLTFMVDGEDEVYQSYLKGERTDLKQFYTMMREGKVFKTSLPNLAESEALFRELLSSGRDVIYLAFSSGLSGTYQALSLAGGLREEFPERKLYAVDTLAASGGQGLLVWYAVQHARSGESIDQVRDWLEDNKLHLAHWFTVDDLMFLFRGGRVSKTAAWAGTLLNIKPVYVDDGGHLIPMEKVCGRKKSLNVDRAHGEIRRQADLRPDGVHHARRLHRGRQYVAGKIRKRFGVKRIRHQLRRSGDQGAFGAGTMALFFWLTNANNLFVFAV